MSTLRFQSRTAICLHLPDGTTYPADGLIAKLAADAADQGKRFAIAQWARPQFEEQSSAEWFAAATGFTPEYAQRTIDEAGTPIADTLSHNAGTPRSVLGIAAALVDHPEVLIYTTAGLDPLGCEFVHRYVASRTQDICTIHVSYPSVHGNGIPAPRCCLGTAHCIPIAELQ